MPKKHFVLERGRKAPLPLILDIPDKTVTIQEVLPILFDIADRTFIRTYQELEPDRSVTCGPGCCHCCRQLVPATDHEALYMMDVMRTLPEDHRKRVEQRYAEGIEKLRNAGLLDGILDFLDNRVHKVEEYKAIQKLYWDLTINCPFLEDESCSIHPHRPIACRQYSVTSPPELCARVFTDAKLAEIHHPVDLGGALAGFDGENARGTVIVPILFARLYEERLRGREEPRLEAERMVARFIDLAGMYTEK
ncbi:YkgJ family cysteine cluster protein [Salidesulfovibrio onnuriiensis]|uniref:YkgJ family cysteine cluster protein n=1 Tax=Salidesulfovibrio onnuriiensis TaxID=2583823 RepID=UPI0011CC43D9|nr:YkgJ family cysteine cluster protein [Salidesulfovibrio onnuriiensis]